MKKNFLFITTLFFALTLFSCASTSDTKNSSENTNLESEENLQSENSEILEEIDEPLVQDEKILQDDENILEEDFQTEIEIPSEKIDNAENELQDLSDFENHEESDESLQDLEDLEIVTDEIILQIPVEEENQEIQGENKNDENSEIPLITNENQDSQNESDENLQTNSTEENSRTEDSLIEAENDDVIIEDENHYVLEDEIEDVLEDFVDFENNEENSQIENEYNVIIVPTPSRQITVRTNEFFDVSYPGRGWIYLGATDSSRNIIRIGRKISGNDTNYSFQAKSAGTVFLHFYKEDPVSQTYIDDYLEVIVLHEKTDSKEHLKVPEYKEIVPEKLTENKDFQNVQNKINSDEEDSKTESEIQGENSENKTENVQNENSQVIQNEENSQSENILEETQEQLFGNEALDQAEKLMSENDFLQALSIVQNFIQNGDSPKDRALFIQAKILESDSSVKNIKESLLSYENLVKNFPSSQYCDEAKKRAIYLKRFYLDAR